MQKSNGLATKDYLKMREAILSGKHLPGEALYEVHLAERFGMSRTPVREALQVLAREGFVDALPGRGFLVPRWSHQDVRELYELRESLEGFATACAAKNITPAEIAELEALHTGYVEATDWEVLVQLGDQFHNKIVAFGRNKRLTKILDSLKAQISMTRVSQLRDLQGRRDESTREHRAILDAIVKRDGDLAERNARFHIRSSYESTLLAFRLGAD
ncbi:MAG: GntR family transcriptional regulator [Xanthobacteraceae bacterium]|nr:GntR family transcriptional regulator [Xanthobacteraceae bacterium]